MSNPQFTVLIGTLMLIASGCFPEDSPAAPTALIASLALYVMAFAWWLI